jgi:capsular polysaccharide biosynthesis protein
MNSSSKPDSLELADYGGVLRRRWWIVVVLMSLGVLAAGVAVKRAAKTYTASTSVYVTALETDTSRALQSAGGPVNTVNMDNEAQIVRSQAVAGLAAKRLRPSPSPPQLIDSVSVTVPQNSTVLNISCRAPSGSDAVACANAVAAAYLAVRLADAEGAVSGALTSLQSKMASVAQVVGRLDAQLPTRRSSPASRVSRNIELRAANAQLQVLMSRVNSLTVELTGLRGPNNILAGHVINPAVPPSSPTSPRKLLLVPSGLVAGLIIGLIVAFWVDSRGQRLHAARDVERLLELPVLLNLRKAQARASTELASRGSRPVRAFAQLAQYAATTPAAGSPALLVVGASPDASVSLVAANLAAALSEVRPGVLLVCPAPEATLAPQLLGVERASGFAQLFAGNATINDVAQTVANFADLRVIGPGIQDADALRGRNHDARRSLVAGLRSQAEYVIVEAPLTSDGPGVFALAEFADAAIIVIETSRTRRSDVADWLRRLERMRIPVLGAVVLPHVAAMRRSWLRVARVDRRRAPEPEAANVAAAQARAAGVPERRGAQ